MKLFLLSVLGLFGLQESLHGQVAINLGSAQSFAALAGTSVTLIGLTIVKGDVGMSPGTTIIGLSPDAVSGTIHSNDSTAQAAQLAALTAYNAISGETASQNLSGVDLGSLTLSPGVYQFSSSAQLTGTLTLDAGNNPNARFDFQIGSTLTTASSASIVLVNGAQASNIYWQVGSSATLGTSTVFDGTIIANQSITTNTGTTDSGRLFALNAAITMGDSNISVPSAIPEPANTALFAGGLAALGIGIWKKRQMQA